MQDKTNIYTINNNVLPSYEDAITASAPPINNPQYDQRYPHIVYPTPSASFPYPYPPNNFPDRVPVQSTFPQFSQYQRTERQMQPMPIVATYRTVIRGKKKSWNRWSIFGTIFVLVITIASVSALFSYY